MEFQIRDSENNQQGYYWRAVANGEVLAWSETMFNKADCASAAQTVKAGNVNGYFTNQASNGYFYWYVNGLNNRKLLSSPVKYASSPAASSAANAVKAHAPYATIVDQTRVSARN